MSLLGDVLTWLKAQPKGLNAFRLARQEFYGDEPGPPEPDDDPIGYLRFIEWMVVDARLGESVPAIEQYGLLASAMLQPRLAEVARSRHGAWRVHLNTSPGATFEPLDGGESVSVDADRLAVIGPLTDRQVVGGRLLPWEDRWMPSPAMARLSLPDAPLAADLFPRDARDVQNIVLVQASMRLTDATGAALALTAAREACDIRGDIRDTWSEVRRANDVGALLAGLEARAARRSARIERLALVIAAGALWSHLHRPEAPAEPARSDPPALATREVFDLYDAVAREDEAGFQAVCGADTELGLIYDLLGFPGLRLYLALEPGQRADGLHAAAIEQKVSGEAQAEMRWIGETGVRGALIYLDRQPGRWRIFGARPELQMVPGRFVATTAYSQAQREGTSLAWRAPCAEPVETKLRASLRSRSLPLERQVRLIAAWRTVNRELEAGLDRQAPEAWAAAIEGTVAEREGRPGSTSDLALRYGAKKSLVKARMEHLRHHWLRHAPAGRPSR